MRRSILLIGWLLLAALTTNAQENQSPKLTGPYLGQKPPGMTPEIFVPGAVSSKDHIEMGCTWSPNLEEFYFARSETSELSSNWAIWCLREQNGVWSEPQVVPFSGVYRDFGPFIPPDGNCMIFIRRDNKENKTRMGSWIVDRKGSTWSEPRFFHEAYCLTTNDFRTFYFSTEGSERDIGRMEFDNGFFSTPVKVPSALNTPEFEAHACLSPDGSYMLFDRTKSTFVSFLRDDGTWSRGYDLGRKYNIPAISPDGKYIFFESDGDIYWVDAKIIEKFRIQGAQKDDFPALTGPYLGQKPPGLAPEVFAPGIISIGESLEAGCAFTPDLKEFYFVRGKNMQHKPAIMVCREMKDVWTMPEVAPFSGVYFDFEPNITPDGTKMFFMRFDRLDSSLPRGLWMMERIGEGWGRPRYVSPGMYATATHDGTIYYTSPDEGEGVVLSRFVNGRYLEPEVVGGGVNRPYPGAHPCISPDESFIVFDSTRPDGKSRSDLYVCFRNKDGTWGDAFALGRELNDGPKNCPALSPDGKYLFYTFFKSDSDADIYWVSTKVVQALKSKSLDSHEL